MKDTKKKKSDASVGTEDRPQTTEITKLSEFLELARVSPSPAGASSAPTDGGTGHLWRRRAALAFAGLALCSLMLAVVLMYTRRSTEPDPSGDFAFVPGTGESDTESDEMTLPGALSGEPLPDTDEPENTAGGAIPVLPPETETETEVETETETETETDIVTEPETETETEAETETETETETEPDRVGVWQEALQASSGLEYTSDDAGGCTLTGLGTCTDAYLIVPPLSPDGLPVTAVGASAFCGSETLIAIVLPATIQRIDKDAFLDCSHLASLTVDASSANYSTLDGVLYDKAQSCLIYYPIAKPSEELTIPSSVTRIEVNAFRDALLLRRVLYAGSQSAWSRVYVGNGNNLLSLLGVSCLE